MQKPTKFGSRKRLTCCCCGSGLIGRQWWNRDTGFGICNNCLELCDVAPDQEYASSYGWRGIHFDLKEVRQCATGCGDIVPRADGSCPYCHKTGVPAL